MDPFQSSPISIVVSWLVAIPLMVSLALYLAFGPILIYVQRRSRLLLLWTAVSYVIFSPLRYIIFQVFLGLGYPFQSPVALASTIAMIFYVPLVAGTLYTIGLGLPLVILKWVAGPPESASRSRTIVAAIALPWCCRLGAFAFFVLLPYAATTVHWLRGADVIRATNGPAYYAYRYFAKLGREIDFPLPDAVVEGSDREYLRAHVASIYLGEAERRRYFEQASIREAGELSQP